MKKLNRILGFLFVLAGVVFLLPANVDAANTLSSSTYRDVNLDGTVDTVVWVMDEDPLLCPYEAGDWAVTVAGDIGITAITGVTCATLNEIAITVTASAGITGGTVAPTITYTQAAGTANSVTLTSGNMTDKSGSPTDLAKPQIRSITYQDADDDGKMDRLDVIYTEQVTVGSFLSANDLLLNVVGSFTGAVIGADASDLIGGTVSATWVPLGTEASVVATYDTLGTLDITAQNDFSLLDASGNNSQDQDGNADQDQLIWTDGINPILLSASRTALNTIVLTFSEPMDTTTTAGEGWTVAGATVTANTDPADTGTTMTLTTTGLTSYSSTPAVTYASATGTTMDIASRELANASTVDAADAVAPTVAVTLSDYAIDIGETALITFTFSEAPTGFTSADVTVPNGTLGTIDASTPTAQTATFTPTADVTDLVNVITVGTGWTDGAISPNAPVGTTDSSNYQITTVSGGGGGGGGSRTKKATPATPAVPTVAPGTPASPNAQGYAFGTLTVKMGTKGEACRAWQMFLNAKSNAGLVTDGWCGKLTIAAAKKWQGSMGLVADGFLGPMSRSKAAMQ
ncbi:MAG: Ig-like domain-containing protein [Candidatus Paceibacterota bacterium]|jgi:hypothetical protein